MHDHKCQEESQLACQANLEKYLCPGKARIKIKMRKLPFDKAWIEETAKKWPTPFHVYDAKAIRENARRLKNAFAWNKGFREYFAVKATPNPHLMKLLKDVFGFGSDCSSMAELVLAEKVGNVGEAIMFTSNDTPAEEFAKAW